MEKGAFNGKYFKTSYGDIRASDNWFGKICLLGLISFIPVFGQMTLYGYSFEWAHKAAWGVEGPMPKKIYGRPGSKMLRWGWFALVIAFVVSLVPSIVNMIGDVLSASGAATAGFMTSGGLYVMPNPGSGLLSGFGWLVTVVGWVLFLFCGLFIWVAIMRMTMYDRLSTGFQIGKIWDMMRRDFGGLLRILGMVLIFEAIFGIIMFMIVMGLLVAVLGASVMPLAYMFNGGMYADSQVAMYIVGLIFMMLPVLLVVAYVCFVFNAFVQLLSARALGYWTRQFDVAAWGTKDDPLPAAGASHADHAPNPPVTPPSGAATTATAPEPAPAPPTGEPVVEEAAQPTGEPAVEDVVVEETVVEPVAESAGAVAEAVDEIDEVEVTIESEDSDDNGR